MREPKRTHVPYIQRNVLPEKFDFHFKLACFISFHSLDNGIGIGLMLRYEYKLTTFIYLRYNALIIRHYVIVQSSL